MKHFRIAINRLTGTTFLGLPEWPPNRANYEAAIAANVLRDMSAPWPDWDDVVAEAALIDGEVAAYKAAIQNKRTEIKSGRAQGVPELERRIAIIEDVLGLS